MLDAVSDTEEMQSEPDAPPRGLCVQRDDDRLRIGRRWVSLYGLVAAPMGVVLIVAGIMRLLAPPAAQTDVWLRYGLPSVLIVAGLACAYAALVGLINRTTITVAPDHVAVEHGPLPWLTARSHTGAALRSIELHEERAGGFFGSGRLYRLEAMLVDESTLTLDMIHDNAAQARWIVEAIRAWLPAENAGT
jgi:hypothetical protein